MLSILFVCLFLVGWIWSEKIQEFLWKWLPLEVCGAWNNSVLQYTGVCVCVTFLCCQSVFICFIQVQNTPQGKCTPTHTHTHTILSTRTYPSSTAATQQMCRAGFNFLAPRLMHFSSRPSCSHPATPAAQCYWLAIKPSNSYKELNILKLLHLFHPSYIVYPVLLLFQVSALMQYHVMNVWCNADDSRFFSPALPHNACSGTEAVCSISWLRQRSRGAASVSTETGLGHILLLTRGICPLADQFVYGNSNRSLEGAGLA